MEKKEQAAGRRWFELVVDVFEIYLPGVLFVVMLGTFLLQVVLRYFFSPLAWPEELVGFLYLWVILLATGYAERDKKLIRFSSLYDSVSQKGQLWMDIVGQTLVVVALAISFPPAMEYILYMGFRESIVLGIPMNLVFAPYPLFLASLILRFAFRLVRKIRIAVSGEAAS